MKRIQVDDIQVGSIIGILKTHPLRVVTKYSSDPWDSPQVTEHPRSHEPWLFQVTALDLPYLCAYCLNTGVPCALDVRDCVFGTPSAERLSLFRSDAFRFPIQSANEPSPPERQSPIYARETEPPPEPDRPDDPPTGRS